MKTTVLGYSKNGVYVEVENSFASVVFDLNTTNLNCAGACFTDYVGKSWDDCNYVLSKSELSVLEEEFRLLGY